MTSPLPATRVLVFGDAGVDVLVEAEEPVNHDSDTRARVRRRLGGSAANQAAWLAHLRTPVTFVGRVGVADVAEQRTALRRVGVDARLRGDATHPTGTVVALVDAAEGTRTMFTDRGANLRLSGTDFEPGVLGGIGWLHYTGYSLFEAPVRAVALEMVARARDLGIPVSVDPSSVAFLRSVGAASFRSWTAGAAVVFPNADEARVLTGRADPGEAAAVLADRYGPAVVKLGGQGAVHATAGHRPQRVEASTGAVVDPTGCGDAFCAGFLSRWLIDRSAAAAVAAAVAAAGEAARTVGGRPDAAATRPDQAIPRTASLPSSSCRG